MTLIDAIGTSGSDPGSAWDVAGTSNATKDKTLVRKSTVVVQILVGHRQQVQQLLILSGLFTHKTPGITLDLIHLNV